MARIIPPKHIDGFATQFVSETKIRCAEHSKACSSRAHTPLHIHEINEQGLVHRPDVPPSTQIDARARRDQKVDGKKSIPLCGNPLQRRERESYERGDPTQSRIFVCRADNRHPSTGFEFSRQSCWQFNKEILTWLAILVEQ
ncbi:hypothetical protein WT83_01805 [Burkholderia territorii]|uniref:Uncharacterized protein n=1 Tax=Burkholderia territorii TaxID=1503055 RepID=A0A108F6T2_9BURK|nr:hypothetical protein WT83_01805 [Burkholderia territorii]